MTRTRISRKHAQASGGATPQSSTMQAEKPMHMKHAEGTPVSGETYRCAGCGMELEITADCGCENADHVRLECCGAAMNRV